MSTLTEHLNRLLFQRTVKGILKTPPIGRGKNCFAALSMVHHRDVLPYLLAIKTFSHFASPERIFLIADPSLDEADRKILLKHIPHLEIREAAEFRRPSLPIGGTWERLSAIAVLCQEVSIVQLDADTMTFGYPEEVVDAMLTTNQSFIIRSEYGVEIQTLDVAAQYGKESLLESNHIQAVSEARFTELKDFKNYRYVRGCSGFSGFGRAAICEEGLAELSISMQSLLGDRWNEWGTEQVSSNLLAASAPNSFLLPHPKYCNADGIDTQTIIAHYIGYARHTNRNYEYRTKAAFEKLTGC